MNKAFEKILERMDDMRKKSCIPDIKGYCQTTISRAEEIVKEVAEEYNGGWIPCSERLPEEWEYYLVCDEQSTFIAEYADYEWRYHSNENTKEYVYVNVIAWQQLPQPYKDGEKND